MSAASLLIAAAILVPLGMAAACLSAGVRSRAPSLLMFAPLPALAAAFLAPDGTSIFFPAPFRMTLALDRPGAMLLGGAALLWSAAGAYASSYLGGKPGAASFSVWWLLTLAGCLGLFLVGDLVSFYLVFSLASLAAYGLIVHEQTPAAHRAGVIYFVLAILGEAFLMLALVILATRNPAANPLIRDVVANLAASPMRDVIVGLFIAAFALKMGLVPLHIWLPLAHPSAPMPASAVLSGVVVKAGVIGLIRFMPFEAGLPAWGTALAVIGIVTAFAGALIGVTQNRPKTILAYSTVSQMGLLAVLLGAGLESADPGTPGLVAFYGVHHTLVKGALFLAVGVIAATGGARLRPVLLLTAILALSLGGLPLTSGALAKLATKPMLGDGLLAQLVTLAAAGSTLLMLHFIVVVARQAADDPASSAPRGEVVPSLIVAAASLTIPWAWYPSMTGEPVLGTLTADALWKIAWPMALGAVAMLVLSRFRRLPGSVPEGDILVLVERGLPIVFRAADAVGQIDAQLRRWPVAGVLLVCFAVLIGGVLALRP